VTRYIVKSGDWYFAGLVEGVVSWTGTRAMAKVFPLRHYAAPFTNLTTVLSGFASSRVVRLVRKPKPAVCHHPDCTGEFDWNWNQVDTCTRCGATRVNHGQWVSK
jgi:hypothetical protein